MRRYFRSTEHGDNLEGWPSGFKAAAPPVYLEGPWDDSRRGKSLVFYLVVVFLKIPGSLKVSLNSAVFAGGWPKAHLRPCPASN
jgi:hypothetical protein